MALPAEFESRQALGSEGAPTTSGMHYSLVNAIKAACGFNGAALV